MQRLYALHEIYKRGCTPTFHNVILISNQSAKIKTGVSKEAPDEAVERHLFQKQHPFRRFKIIGFDLTEI